MQAIPFGVAPPNKGSRRCPSLQVPYVDICLPLYSTLLLSHSLPLFSVSIAPELNKMSNAGLSDYADPRKPPPSIVYTIPDRTRRPYSGRRSEQGAETEESEDRRSGAGLGFKEGVDSIEGYLNQGSSYPLNNDSAENKDDQTTRTPRSILKTSTFVSVARSETCEPYEPCVTFRPSTFPDTRYVDAEKEKYTRKEWKATFQSEMSQKTLDQEEGWSKDRKKQARRLEEERATARLLRWDFIDPPRVVVERSQAGVLRKPPEDTTHSPRLNTGGRAHVHHHRSASETHPTSSQTKPRESSRTDNTNEDKEKDAGNKLRRHRRRHFDERPISVDAPDVRAACRTIAPAVETEGGRKRHRGHTRYHDGISVTDQPNERSSTQSEGKGAITSERGSNTGRKAKIHSSHSRTEPIAEALSRNTESRLRPSNRRSPAEEERETAKRADRARPDAGASRTVRSRRHHQGEKSNSRCSSP
jgi:hypothetical protein